MTFTRFYRYGHIPGSSKWIGAVRTPNGYIYGIPYNYNSVLKYDFRTNTFQLIGDLPGLCKWRDGILGPNGKIYGIPCDSPHILEIDPTTDRINFIGNFGTTPSKFGGVALASNGKLYSIPASFTQILEFDPNTQTINLFGTFDNTVNKWLTTVSGPNNKIYGIPYNSRTIVEVDVNTKSVNYIATYLFGDEKWVGGVLAPNNKIYGIPFNSNQILEIDPITKEITLFGGLSGINKWWGAVVGPNGKIYGIPCDFPHILEIDPWTKEINLLTIFFSQNPEDPQLTIYLPPEDINIELVYNKWRSGTVASGKIYFIPFDYYSILEFYTDDIIDIGEMGTVIRKRTFLGINTSSQKSMFLTSFKDSSLKYNKFTLNNLSVTRESEKTLLSEFTVHSSTQDKSLTTNIGLRLQLTSGLQSQQNTGRTLNYGSTTNQNLQNSIRINLPQSIDIRNYYQILRIQLSSDVRHLVSKGIESSINASNNYNFKFQVTMDVRNYIGNLRLVPYLDTKQIFTRYTTQNIDTRRYIQFLRQTNVNVSKVNINHLNSTTNTSSQKKHRVVFSKVMLQLLKKHTIQEFQSYPFELSISRSSGVITGRKKVKIFTINLKKKLFKLNNTSLGISSKNFDSRKVRYSVTFQNGVINNLPSSTFEIVHFHRGNFGQNPLVVNLYGRISHIINDMINKKESGFDSRLVFSMFVRPNSHPFPSVFELKIRFRNNSILVKEKQIVPTNKFQFVMIELYNDELPNITDIEEFTVIVDGTFDVKNLIVYQVDGHQVPINYLTVSDVVNCIISPFGLQNVKDLKVISDFTVLDTLDYYQLERYMDFTPKNGQSPTYSKYIRVFDETTVGEQYSVLYRFFENTMSNQELTDDQIVNRDRVICVFGHRPTKVNKLKRYRIKTEIRKIKQDPSLNQNQYLLYQGFDENNTSKHGINIGFGSYGTYNYYPVFKPIQNIPTNYETWTSPTIGYGTTRLIPEYYHYHTQGVIINYQYPYSNVDSKLQVRSIETYEVDENDVPIYVNQLVQTNNPLLYYLYIPIIKDEPLYNISHIDVKFHVRGYINGTLYRFENTLPPLLPKDRLQQTTLDRLVRYYYNIERTDFFIQTPNDYILIDNLKDVRSDKHVLYFELMSTDPTTVNIDIQNELDETLLSYQVELTKPYYFKPVFIRLQNVWNIKKIKIYPVVITKPIVVSIKNVKQIDVIDTRLPLDYLNYQNLFDNWNTPIQSIDGITKTGQDWLRTIYGFNRLLVVNNQFESLILPPMGIHIFKRQLYLNENVNYNFYMWIKNSFVEINHQIMTRSQTLIPLTPELVTEYDEWKLYKVSFTPPSSDWYQYVIYRNHQYYDVDQFVSGFTCVVNDKNIPILNTPSQLYDVNGQYVEFSDLYLPNNWEMILRVSHVRIPSMGKSVIFELTDGTTVYELSLNPEGITFIENNDVRIQDLMEFDLDKLYEIRVKKVDNNIFLTVQRIENEDTTTVFERTCLVNNQIYGGFCKLRLGDNSNFETEDYTCNFIDLHILEV